MDKFIGIENFNTKYVTKGDNHVNVPRTDEEMQLTLQGLENEGYIYDPQNNIFIVDGLGAWIGNDYLLLESDASKVKYEFKKLGFEIKMGNPDKKAIQQVYPDGTVIYNDAHWPLFCADYKKVEGYVEPNIDENISKGHSRR